MAHDLSNIAGRKIILGLSGGVDSAVAAVRLQDAGAEVEALHMTNWEDDDGYCTAAADLQDARKVCERLDIPLHHVNFAAEYRDRVFQYFLDEYRSGRTPNPDVLCNREIKFGVFREHARRLGGELLATGHYARVADVDGESALLKGIDPDKDQSYFLHAVGADAFEETVFPLGDLFKADVRRIAKQRGLNVHAKKDSTGICFIGERPFREFLGTYLPAQPGPIRTADGRPLGTHSGLMYYTLGQRQGLGIGGRRDSDDEPWYVVAKDVDDNVLVVDQGDTPLLLSAGLVAADASWIGVRAGGAGPWPLLHGKDTLPASRSGMHSHDGRPWRVACVVRYAAARRRAGAVRRFLRRRALLGGAVIDAAEPISRVGPAAEPAAISQAR